MPLIRSQTLSVEFSIISMFSFRFSFNSRRRPPEPSLAPLDINSLGKLKFTKPGKEILHPSLYFNQVSCTKITLNLQKYENASRTLFSVRSLIFQVQKEYVFLPSQQLSYWWEGVECSMSIGTLTCKGGVLVVGFSFTTSFPALMYASFPSRLA